MTTKNIPEQQHNIEIHDNLNSWHKKPILQKIYQGFYELIAASINTGIEGKIVELGSGIGNMKMVIPDVITTDIFPNPWIDQVENAYHLSFENETLSNIILFDVWHHLKYPGTVLEELNRVLKKDGRIVLFEPAMSLFGLLIYGLLHHEPVGITKKIAWYAKEPSDLSKNKYYAAQGNASRIFTSSKYDALLKDWKKVKVKKLSAISYVLTGGYSKHQFYPDRLLPFFRSLDKLFDLLPFIFATRLLVVMEKK
jgi:SAM-dependent methyltransferase